MDLGRFGLMGLVLAVALGGPWACDSGNRASPPADIELSADGVVYVNGELAATITARVVDSDGEPVNSVLIRLTHDGTGIAIDPVVGTSGDDGQVEFSLSTQQGGSVQFQAEVDLDDLAMGDPLALDFNLALSLSAGSVELTTPGGRVEVLATVADASGPIEGVPLRVISDRVEDAVGPVNQDSDAQGEAVFDVTTVRSGPAMLTLMVDGLNLVDTPSSAVDFVGPILTGTWSHLQPGAIIAAPRIGLLWINFGLDIFGDHPTRELMSMGIAEVPELGQSGTFELRLPLHAPQEDLYDPDPENPELPETFVIAPYAIAVYDDLDGSGDFSGGDSVLALTDENVLATYVEGELPDPQDIPDLVHGYQFMDPFVDGDPIVVAFDQLADEHDLELRMAPCPAGPLSGTINFGDALPEGENTRVAVLLINANLIFDGRFFEMFDVGNFVDLVSQPVAYAANTSLEYTLDLPEPGSVYPDYQDLLVDLLPSMPAFGIMAPIVYVDSDSNGVFTNDDSDINTGDRLVGYSDLPFGHGTFLLEWLDGPIGAFVPLLIPGLNEGYNLILEPLTSDINQVIDDTTLNVVENIESGHAGLPFRIQREINGEQEIVISGSDLVTLPGQRVGSASGGFAGVVQADDELVITNQLEEGQVLDLDTPFDIAVQ